MELKKQHFAEGVIQIFDGSCIYMRGEYWQFRMCLQKANKQDEATSTELQQPTTAREAPLFKSLDGVDELEQYEHLSQLLHIQKHLKKNHEFIRN